MASVRSYSEVPPLVKRISTAVENLSRPERIRAALNYKPKSGEICLASGLKCGTTWIQQILHGLRSGGDMNFEEIDEVIPCIEFSPYGADIDAPQPFQPQIYKTHLPFETCPKGFDKYIVTARNPKDAAVSAHWHLRDWIFTSEEMDLNEFVDYFIASEISEECKILNGVTLKHQASWYPHRKDSNVLWLHFEDLKQDLRKCIELISEFVGIGVGNSDLLDLVERQASFEFMKKHESKFRERPMRRLRNVAVGLDPEAGMNSASKVRNGTIGEGKRHLNQEIADAIDARWQRLLAPFTDAKSYEEMRQDTLRELDRSFDDA